MSDGGEKPILLTERDESYYRQRGPFHQIDWYDGPILGAQMCVAYKGTRMVEVIVDHRFAETDGTAVYIRLSRSDLLGMLRALDDEPVEHPSTHMVDCDQRPCRVCWPDKESADG